MHGPVLARNPQIADLLLKLALDDEDVALVAVGAEQVRVDPDDPQLVVAHLSPLKSRAQLPTRRRRSWNAV